VKTAERLRDDIRSTRKATETLAKTQIQTDFNARRVQIAKKSRDMQAFSTSSESIRHIILE